MVSPADNSLPLCKLEDAFFPGSLATLPALELGAAVSLLLAAWPSSCELDARETALAMTARVELDVWRRVQERVSIALDLVTIEGSTRVVLARARKEQDRMLAHAAAVRAQKAEAGRKGGLARAASAGDLPAAAPPPTPTLQQQDQAPAKHLLSTCQAPASNLSRVGALRAHVRAGGAHELRDSNANALSSRAEAQPTGEQTADVLGKIDAGLDDLLRLRLTTWRTEQSRKLLTQACEKWLAGGIDPCWQKDREHEPKNPAADRDRTIRRIAGHPNVRPELVAIALHREQEANAASKLGYVASALGTTRYCREQLTPNLQDQPIVDDWAARESAFIAECKVTTAVRNVIAKVSQHAPQALAPHTRTNAGGVA